MCSHLDLPIFIIGAIKIRCLLGVVDMQLRAISSPKVVKSQINGASALIPLERSKWLEGG